MKIMVSFQIQGTVGLLASAVLWYLKMHLPSTRRFVIECLERQCITFFYAQLVLAISLPITALSKYETITLYHLFICTQLIWIIKSGFGILQIGSLFPTPWVSAFHSSMQLLFVLAWMGLDMATLYRVRKWENKPGECFIAYYNGGEHDRHDLEFMLCVDLTAITYFAFIVPLLKYLKWEHIVPRHWRTSMEFLAGFLQLTFLFGCFIWTSISIYVIKSTNREYLVDSESKWGFGQVNAVVTTAFSLTGLLLGCNHRSNERPADNDARSETRV
jgi:hypothetical protein